MSMRREAAALAVPDSEKREAWAVPSGAVELDDDQRPNEAY